MKRYTDHFRTGFGVEAEPAANEHDDATADTFPLRRVRSDADTGVPSLSVRQHRALTNLVDAIDQDTKHQMIVQHLRMVVSIAKHYTNRGLDLVELVRAGNQGLLHAMERFEPAGGFCFTTFLTWCVGREIELAIMRRNADRSSLLARDIPADASGDAGLLDGRNRRKHPPGCSLGPS